MSETTVDQGGKRGNRAVYLDNTAVHNDRFVAPTTDLSPPYLPKPHPLDPVWHLLRVQYGGPDSGRVLSEPDRFAAPSPPNSPRQHPWDPKPEPRTPAPVAPPSPAPGNRLAVYSTKPLAEVSLDKQNNGKSISAASAELCSTCSCRVSSVARCCATHFCDRAFTRPISPIRRSSTRILLLTC